MVGNYYVRRDMDTDPDTVTNKLPRAGLQTSYVHSSIKTYLYLFYLKLIRLWLNLTLLAGLVEADTVGWLMVEAVMAI